MRFWLMKSEPDAYSIDDLAVEADCTTPWTGVRNYQARNFMRDQMRPGDLAFFYHSNCKVPGIAGLMKVVSPAYPDPTQFEAGNKYFDARASSENPRWFLVDVQRVAKTAFVPLSRLRETPALARMRILAKGNRLSITPVDPREWQCITRDLMGLPE